MIFRPIRQSTPPSAADSLRGDTRSSAASSPSRRRVLAWVATGSVLPILAACSGDASDSEPTSTDSTPSNEETLTGLLQELQGTARGLRGAAEYLAEELGEGEGDASQRVAAVIQGLDQQVAALTERVDEVEAARVASDRPPHPERLGMVLRTSGLPFLDRLGTADQETVQLITGVVAWWLGAARHLDDDGQIVDVPEDTPRAGIATLPNLHQLIYGEQVLTSRLTGGDRFTGQDGLEALTLHRRNLMEAAGNDAPVPEIAYQVPAEWLELSETSEQFAKLLTPWVANLREQISQQVGDGPFLHVLAVLWSDAVAQQLDWNLEPPAAPESLEN